MPNKTGTAVQTRHVLVITLSGGGGNEARVPLDEGRFNTKGSVSGKHVKWLLSRMGLDPNTPNSVIEVELDPETFEKYIKHQYDLE